MILSVESATTYLGRYMNFNTHQNKLKFEESKKNQINLPYDSKDNIVIYRQKE